MSASIIQTGLPETNSEFLEAVKAQFASSNLEFARSYYLFATARLEKEYNSSVIYAKYPLLHSEETFKRLKTLYDQHPEDEEIKRLFVDALGTYIGNRLSRESDELTNLKDQLKIDLTGLDIPSKDGETLMEILYEDTPELFKRLADKPRREALYERVSTAYCQTVTPKFIDLFHQENRLFAELGYPDLIDFYSRSSGHPLKKLGDKAALLVSETETMYLPLIEAFYQARTGHALTEATRADIAYVFHGASEEMAELNTRFPESRLVELARQTFDTLGLNFSALSDTIDFSSRTDYDRFVDDSERPSRILLDIAKREGKRSRAYVYPARVPNEVYLSVKPEGGLDDYAGFFHESGHALHFAYTSPQLSYPLALMGNNTVTESYAYLFQNLFLNRHWLMHAAGLSAGDAAHVVRRTALNDLYMMRRYASKMRFELALYDGTPLDGKPDIYARLLTEGTGFRYDADGWSRDVDAGFYVADYFTAWALEAQLRETLQTRFGSEETNGEDWYRNPEAGAFLKSLWRDGNLTQAQLSERLGYNDPTDVGPLLRFMARNLQRS